MVAARKQTLGHPAILDTAGGLAYTLFTDGGGVPVLVKFAKGTAFTTAFTAVGKLEIQGPVFTGCMIEAGTFPPQAAAGVD